MGNIFTNLFQKQNSDNDGNEEKGEIELQDLDESEQMTAIQRIESKYDEQLKAIDEQKKVVDSEIEFYTINWENEIDELTKRDELKASMQEKIASKEIAYNNVASNFSAINRNRRNKIEKKDILSKECAAKEKRIKKLETGIESHKQKNIIFEQKLNEYYDKRTQASNKLTNWYYESKRAKTEKEIQENNNEMVEKVNEINSLTPKIESLKTEIDNLQEDIDKMEIEEQEAVAQAKELEEKIGQDKSELADMNVEEDPDWYKEYKALKSQQDQLASKHNSLETEKNDVNTVMQDSEYDEDTPDEVILEEAKVEAALKKAPIFQTINKDILIELQNYNPDTGGQYSEGEEKKSSNLLVNDIDNLMSKENIKMLEELSGKLKDNKMVKSIDNIINKAAGDGSNLLQDLLDRIGKGSLNDVKAWLITNIEKYSSAEFRQESPIAAGLASIIFESIGDILNIGDKSGSDPTGGKEFDRAVGNFGTANGGETLGTILQTLSGLVTAQDLVKLVITQAVKFGVSQNRVTKSVKNLEEAGTNFLESAKNFARQSEIGEYEKQIGRSNEKDTPQLMRMLEGAKAAAKSNGIQNVVNGVGEIGKSASNMFLGSVVGTVVNFGITGVTKLINVFVNSRVEGKHKKELLSSPEVLGNVNYNEKLVSEEKFNEKLRKVSGISTKDKLYGAIKTADAIALHAAMRKSTQTPDARTDMVMSGLGFKDKSLYPKISVYDIMKSTGYKPSGGDWRKELSDALLVEGEGKDYMSLGTAAKKAAKEKAIKGAQAAKRGIVKGVQFAGDVVKGGAGLVMSAGRWVINSTNSFINRRKTPEMDVVLP